MSVLRAVHAARTVVAAATVATLLLTAAPALGAGATTEVTVTRGIVLDTTAFGASRACGFPIELHTVGMEVDIRHYAADGTLLSETLQQHFDGYLLNPANGKRIASRVSGPERWVYGADGSVTDTTTGSTVRTAPGAGLVSGFIGRSRVTLVPTGEVDEDGNPVYDVTDETVSGQFLGNDGICAILS